MPGPYPNPGFPDVPTNHPFYTEIAWAAGEGIATGYTNGTFQPATNLSRGAMVAYLYRLLGEPAGPFPNPGFPDVPTNHPFFKEISWAADEGITGGLQRRDVPTGRPGQPPGAGRVPAAPRRRARRPFPNPGYSDVPAGPFRDAIWWAAYKEITQGFPDGTFKPSNPISRQATAAFLYRFEPNLIRP